MVVWLLIVALIIKIVNQKIVYNYFFLLILYAPILILFLSLTATITPNINTATATATCELWYTTGFYRHHYLCVRWPPWGCWQYRSLFPPPYIFESFFIIIVIFLPPHLSHLLSLIISFSYQRSHINNLYWFFFCYSNERFICIRYPNIYVDWTHR